MSRAPFVGKWRSIRRKLRYARVIARAMKCPNHPIVAHIIPTRRCNLACAYCNEYDHSSKPVPTSTMLERLDRLAALGTSAVTLSGGEPLLHPELDTIIRHIRGRGMIATLITNGYLLTPERIRRLNKAGLDHLQISIDNVMPDDVSKKSLKVLDKKLQWLAENATFDVNINSVLGAEVRNPEDALQITRRAKEFGFSTSIGIIHDGTGQLVSLDAKQQSVYERVVNAGKKSWSSFAYYNQFQRNLVRGLPNDWDCRAGSRYLYICEDGLVHYCSQQRGHPGIPLERYTRDDLTREYHTKKGCAPYCTIACVHQVSSIDFVRERPLEALARFFPAQDGDATFTAPAAVRILTWLFLPEKNGSPKGHFRSALSGTATRLLGIR
jgi:MoaA/NifB/PqqE/SkfB family radical SAM enzyme